MAAYSGSPVRASPHKPVRQQTTACVSLSGWTFITLTTIGFSEVHPLSSAARLFTIFIAIVGIGSGAFIAIRKSSVMRRRMRLNRYLRRNRSAGE